MLHLYWIFSRLILDTHHSIKMILLQSEPMVPWVPWNRVFTRNFRRHLFNLNTMVPWNPDIYHNNKKVRLVLLCLTPLLTIFQLYRGDLFYFWRKPEYPDKTSGANNWQTLSRNVVSSTPRLRGVWTHNFSGERHWLHW